MIYWFATFKSKFTLILSINGVSPNKTKRRISAALWRSLILQILQTDNLRRKNTRVSRVPSIHKLLYANGLKQKWWPDPESNWGHGDFQSPALPTELSGNRASQYSYFFGCVKGLAEKMREKFVAPGGRGRRGRTGRAIRARRACRSGCPRQAAR